MTKEPLLNKLIKRFYGVNDTLDEYQEKELNRIGQMCFLILLTYNLLASIIVAIIASKFPSEGLLIGYLIANFFIISLLLPIFITISVKRLGIIGPKEVEPHELAKERKKAIKRGLLSGLLFTISFSLFVTLMDWWFDDIPFMTSLTSIKHIIRCLTASAIFTIFMTLGSYSSIKVISENED